MPAEHVEAATAAGGEDSEMKEQGRDVLDEKQVSETEGKRAEDTEEVEVEVDRQEDAEMKEGVADYAGDDSEGDGQQQDKSNSAEGEQHPAEATEATPEPAKELEVDAPADSRPALKAGLAGISLADTTLNVMPSCDGRVLMSLCDVGMHHFVAAARANVGVKGGRYLFEVRVLEVRAANDASFGRGPAPPRHVLRIGYSTFGSSTFLCEGDHYVGFDTDGHLLAGKQKSKVSGTTRIAQHIIGVLLNLDSSSPNANTISLFRDGVRACQPQPLPAALRGKTLYPTINYKGLVLQLNLGPKPLAPLPFQCRTLQEAAEADVELSPCATRKHKDQSHVLFPVGLPDEGTFEWLDGFLKSHPDFVELSDRAVLEWARLSEIPRPTGYTSRSTNDRPGMNFGVKELDDFSVRRLLTAVAPALRRNCVVMEVRNNLLATERQKMLEAFRDSDSKKVAAIVMGEPPEDFKKGVRARTLESKQAKAVAEVRRKRDFSERQPTQTQKSEDGADARAEGGNDDVKETLEEAIQRIEAQVELSPEEQQAWFRKSPVEDIAQRELGQCFGSFSLPGAGEGFDEVKFEWQQEAACTKYLKTWVSEKKLTQRVENVQPGDWFRDLQHEWQRLSDGWRRRQNERDLPARRHDAERAHRSEAKNQDNHEQENKEHEEDEKQTGGEPQEAKGEADSPKDVKAEDLDVFAVGDVCDIGNGEALFAKFAHEDWTLLSLRFELHALVHSFKRDINDPERPSFHENHLQFYYNKYFKRTLNFKHFGVDSALELLELVKDSVAANPRNGILEAQLSDDSPLDNFVKLTEDERRERGCRIDAGDETAALKIMRQPPQNHGGYQRPQGHAPPPHRQSQHAHYSQHPSYHQGPRSGGLSSHPAPPPVNAGSRGPPPASRGYSSNNRDAVGASSSRSSGGGNGFGGNSGYSSRGSHSGNPPPPRYGSQPPAAAMRGSHSPGMASRSSYNGSGRRQDSPHSNNMPPHKQARTSSYGSASQPSRGGGGGGYMGSGSSSGRGGGSYGGGSYSRR